MKLYTLLLPLMLVACSTDIGGDDIKKGHSTVHIVLQQTDMDISQPKAMRSNYHDDGDDIHNAYVVMYNTKTKKIEHIINVPANAGETEYKLKEVATIATENGEYQFYNLANMADFVTTPATPDASTHEVTQLTTNGATFAVGSSLPTDLERSTYACAFNGYKLPTTGIPMTNAETFEVDKDRTITLSLYRMLAKMQFTIKNKSAATLQVRSLRVGSLTLNDEVKNGSHTSLIKFLPPKDDDNLVTTNFDNLPHDTSTVEVYQATADKAITLAPGADQSTTIPNCYINESEAATSGQSFPLRIELARSTDNGATYTTDVRNALIQLSKIPRNNVALVTLNLTDYVLKLTANAYAPIGGYPPYVLKRDNEFYVTFTGGGDFELRPSLYEYADKENPEHWIDLNDKTKVSDYALSVTDPDGIFSQQPAFDATTGEILGTLDSNQTGTATLRLTIHLVTGTNTTLTYSRTIYIVNQ